MNKVGGLRLFWYSVLLPDGDDGYYADGVVAAGGLDQAVELVHNEFKAQDARIARVATLVMPSAPGLVEPREWRDVILLADRVLGVPPTSNDNVLRARKDDPAGCVCAECGSVNEFADDVGWIYVGPPYRAVCEQCWKAGRV